MLGLALVSCATAQPLESNTPTQDLSCSESASLTRTQRLLVGTWRHVELVRIVDGELLAPQPSDGENIAHFYCDGTWDTSGPRFRSAGTIKWVSDDEIEQTVVTSNLVIQLGWVSTRRVVVDETNLELQIHQTPEQTAQIMPRRLRNGRQMDTFVITRFRRVQNSAVP